MPAVRKFRQLFTPKESMHDLASQTGKVATSFEIRPVATQAELTQVGQMRQSGYRLPSNSQLPVQALDFANHTFVLGAFDTRSDQLLGTMRVLLTARGPSEIGEYVELPAQWGEVNYIEARHLCVPRSDQALLVKILLCKALYLMAIDHDCLRAVIATRPALLGFYRLFHFDDLSDKPLDFVPPGTRTAHRVMGLNLGTLQAQWSADEENATLYRIFFEQEHPGLRLPIGASSINPLFGGDIESNFPPGDIIPDAS